MSISLEDLYAMIPSIECKGLCWDSCGPIELSPAEYDSVGDRRFKHRKDIAAHLQAGHEIDDFDACLRCPHLTVDKKCDIYARRPAICRLWGVTEMMECPHGCKPAGGRYLTAKEAFRILDLIAGLTPARSAKEREATRKDMSAYSESIGVIVRAAMISSLVGEGEQ